MRLFTKDTRERLGFGVWYVRTSFASANSRAEYPYLQCSVKIALCAGWILLTYLPSYHRMSYPAWVRAPASIFISFFAGVGKLGWS